MRPPGDTRHTRWGDGPRLPGVRAWSALLLCCACLVSPTPQRAATAQTIAGVLLERGTDRPVDLGLVSLISPQGDSIASTLTDERGRFTLTGPRADDYLLAAAAWGYETTVARSLFSLDPGGRIELEFRIPRAPIELPGLTVRADQALITQHPLVINGFVERAQFGFGRFLGPRQIEDAHARNTLDLLTTSGRIMVEERPDGTRILMRNTSGLCTPLIYLDGIPTAIGDVSLNSIVPLRVLMGVEVYRSAVEAPQQYARNAQGCGVVLLWTRSR